MKVDLYDGNERNKIRDEFRSDVWRIIDCTPFEMVFSNRDGRTISIKSETELSVTRTE